MGNRLLLQPIDDTADKTAGGLWLPPSADERQRYRRWEVLAVGAGVLDPVLLPGVEVIAAQYAGSPVRFAKRDLMVVTEEMVLAVVED